MTPDNTRRQRLVAAAKVMGWLAMGAIGIVLYQAVPSQGPAGKPVARYHLQSAAPGAFTLLDWRGRPLLFARRTSRIVEVLAEPNSALRDSESTHSRQPESARNPYRSVRPEWFVALAVGTGSGCLVEPVSASDPPGVHPWHGGFRDTCDGSLYDPAGRVYDGSPATRNLPIPSYRFDGEYLVLEE